MYSELQFCTFLSFHQWPLLILSWQNFICWWKHLVSVYIWAEHIQNYQFWLKLTNLLPKNCPRKYSEIQFCTCLSSQEWPLLILNWQNFIYWWKHPLLEILELSVRFLVSKLLFHDLHRTSSVLHKDNNKNKQHVLLVNLCNQNTAPKKKKRKKKPECLYSPTRNVMLLGLWF